MEAARATTSPAATDLLGGETARELGSDKAGRIVEAMRVSVASRGVAGSTFDHVARTAGVSRGLLHYYFGTKERLLVEAVRREAQVRIERIEQAIQAAQTPEDVLAGLVHTFEDFLGEGPTASVMFYEAMTLALRNDEIALELAELGRRSRHHLAAALQLGRDAGVLGFSADPEDVSTFLFALADGVMVRRLSEPELDLAPLMGQAAAAARAVLE